MLFARELLVLEEDADTVLGVRVPASTNSRLPALERFALLGLV